MPALVLFPFNLLSCALSLQIETGASLDCAACRRSLRKHLPRPVVGGTSQSAYTQRGRERECVCEVASSSLTRSREDAQPYSATGSVSSSAVIEAAPAASSLTPQASVESRAASSYYGGSGLSLGWWTAARKKGEQKGRQSRRREEGGIHISRKGRRVAAAVVVVAVKDHQWTVSGLKATSWTESAAHFSPSPSRPLPAAWAKDHRTQH
jgi:hypothetical protein